MVLGEGGAQRRDRPLEPRHHRRDHVEIALDHDHRLAAPRRLPRRLPVVEHEPLVEELGLGRVEILGRHIGAERPAPEGDHPPAEIGDREHHPVAEAVVGERVVLALRHEPRIQHFLRRHPVGGEVLLEPVAAVGREPDAEPRLRLRAHPALVEIAARPRPDIVAERCLEIGGRDLHDVVERPPRLLPLLLARVARGHRHPRHPGELFDRLGKAHPRLFGQEPEMVPGHPAAEAVVDALPVVGMEARRLLPVERAAGPEIPTIGLALALVPDDVLAHHLRNRQALSDLIEEAVGKAHRCSLITKPGCPRL